MAIGQLDYLKASPCLGAGPLSDDDGQSVRAGQPRHIVHEEQGFAMSEIEIVEQEYRTRLLRRGDEELAHCHEPALACSRQLSIEGLLKLGPAPGRDRVEQSGVCSGHLVENLGDAQVRTAAGRRRSRQPDGKSPAPGGLCSLMEQLRLSRPGTAADLDRRSEARG